MTVPQFFCSARHCQRTKKFLEQIITKLTHRSIDLYVKVPSLTQGMDFEVENNVALL